MESLIFNMYQGIGLDSGKITIYILLYILYIFIALYSVGNLKYIEMNRNAKYIYTRTTDRRIWYIKGVFKQALFWLIEFMIFNAIIYAIDIILNIKINNLKQMPIILALWFLHIVFLKLLLNVISLFSNSKYIINIIFAVDVFQVITASYVVGKFNRIPNWFIVVPSLNGIKTFSSTENNFILNVAIIVVESVLVLMAGIIRVNKVDIIE